MLAAPAVRFAAVPLSGAYVLAAVDMDSNKASALALAVASFATAVDTKASVASFVDESPAVCVVPVVPFGNAGVPERFAAVPVVFAFGSA